MSREPLRVYFAAPYPARDALAPYVDELKRIGMQCVSQWLGEAHTVDGGTTGAAHALDDATVGRNVDRDLADIRRAHVLVAFTADSAAEHLDVPVGSLPSLHSGGRHVETGYAIAQRIPVIVIGPPENIFHRSLILARGWHDAVLHLIALRDKTILDHEPVREPALVVERVPIRYPRDPDTTALRGRPTKGWRA